MPPFEIAIAGFIALMVLLIVVVRAKRSHDQRRRRAASSGFYDFDLARYGTPSAGNSLMEKAAESASRPLAPSFISSGGAGKGKGKGKGKGAGHMATAPIPSSFGVSDRSSIGLLPAFDQETALRHRPPGEATEGLPIPSVPSVPVPSATAGSGNESSLPLLAQPPPPPSAPPT
jgi:hypothetical protein